MYLLCLKSQCIITGIWLKNTLRTHLSLHIPWETSCTLWPGRHTWGKSTRTPKLLRQTLYCSPMAPKKPNKHTLETYYSEWDITMAGSITAGITPKIYSLLKDKENNKTKFCLIRHNLRNERHLPIRKTFPKTKWSSASHAELSLVMVSGTFLLNYLSTSGKKSGAAAVFWGHQCHHLNITVTAVSMLWWLPTLPTQNLHDFRVVTVSH